MLIVIQLLRIMCMSLVFQVLDYKFDLIIIKIICINQSIDFSTNSQAKPANRCWQNSVWTEEIPYNTQLSPYFPLCLRCMHTQTDCNNKENRKHGPLVVICEPSSSLRLSETNTQAAARASINWWHCTTSMNATYLTWTHPNQNILLRYQWVPY